MLDASVPVIDNGGTGRAWNLDVLGNWSGDQTNQRSVIDYTFSSGNPGYSSGDTITAYTHHDTDATNQIVQHHQTPSSVATTDFHYDKAGNVILDNEHFYKYDAWNRVVRVNERGTLAVSGDAFTGTSGGAVAWYKYDALGRRIYKGVFDPSDQEWDGNYFYYDGHRMLEHRKTNAGNTAVEPHRRYVYGLDYIDEVVAYYDTGSADPDPHFVLQDANYDVVAVTDHQGYLEQQYSYAPYGAYQYIEDGSGNAEGNGPADLTELLIPLGRNGLILDRETGLYYNRARYYDPLLSRFLQADPNGTGLVAVKNIIRDGTAPVIDPGLLQGNHRGGDTLRQGPSGHIDGMSLYEYVSSRPSGFTDPRGLWKIQRTGGARARAVAAPGDTVISLAEKIGLDPDEYGRWLRARSDAPWPASTTDPIESGTYSIPNTVVHMRGQTSMGDIWLSIRMAEEMSGAKLSLEEEGFLVDAVNLTTRDQMLTRLRQEPDLHGFAYWGHGGASGVLVPSGTKKKGSMGDLVSAADPDLSHKLAFIRLHACYSAERLRQNVHSWLDLVAPGGEFFGIEGEIKITHYTGPNDPIVVRQPGI